jgi:predicted permease
MSRFLRRLRFWWTRERLARELAEEIEDHRLQAQARLEADGLAPADAALESRRRMGNVTLAREASRENWGWPALDSILQDGAYALRQIRRQPGFTLLAAGTLALGIGLNTTVFTIYSALALRPWPVADARQVVNLVNRSPREIRQRGGGGPGGFSLEEAAFLAASARTLSGVVTTRSGGGNQRLADDDASISWVGGSYFAVLGVPMAVGRPFTPAEDRLQTPANVAVLSFGYWSRAFGADPSIAGRQVRFEDVPFTIVGVTAREFTGTLSDRTDVWMPMASAQLLRPSDRWVLNVLLKPGNCCVAVAARLRPGSTRAEAAAELTLLDARYRAERGIATPGDGVRVTGTEFMADDKNGAGGELTAMFAGVALVLLLACANVGNLLVSRGFVRRREIAVRLALGASRTRVVRQLLTEGFVLAGIGAVVGLWLTAWLPRALVSVVSANAGLQLSPDRTVLLFTLAVTVISCLCFAFAPAIHATSADVSRALKDGGHASSRRFRLRGMLLGVQVATVVVLLAAAGLLLRAVSAAGNRDFGYDVEELSFASLAAPPRGYDAARISALSTAVRAGVDDEGLDSRVALTSTPPLGSGNIKGAYRLADSSEDFFNSVYEVSPSYFDVAGVRLVAGRALQSTDTGRPAIVVSESLARRHWTVQSAVGRRLVSSPPTGGFNLPGELEIVGVARDASMTGISSVDDTIYQSLSGRTLPYGLFRSRDGEAAETFTAIAARLDPRLRVRIHPLSDNLDQQLRGSRLAALLASSLGGIAVALATVGLFGVFAFSVQQRTREIGVRMALGARRLDVIRLVVASNGVPLMAGLGAGAAASLGAARLLRSYLMGLDPVDPLTYAAVAAVLAVAASLATFVPVRRATRVDPLLALRHE